MMSKAKYIQEIYLKETNSYEENPFFVTCLSTKYKGIFA